jgi:hypothetical protein
METMVTAHIDVSRPAGRRLIKDLEKHRKVVSLNYPCPKLSGVGYTLEESYNNGLDLLSELYGTDFRKI